MQSRKTSFVEACINTVIGFLVTLCFSPAIYYACDITATGKQMWLVTLCFTVVSVLRSYVIRRFFNNTIDNKNKNP